MNFGRERNHDEVKRDHLQEHTSAQTFKQQMFTGRWSSFPRMVGLARSPADGVNWVTSQAGVSAWYYSNRTEWIISSLAYVLHLYSNQNQPMFTSSFISCKAISWLRSQFSHRHPEKGVITLPIVQMRTYRGRRRKQLAHVHTERKLRIGTETQVS